MLALQLVHSRHLSDELIMQTWATTLSVAMVWLFLVDTFYACFARTLQYLTYIHILQDEFPHAAHHKEVAIHVTNYTLKHSDSGLVIVGGSMVVQPQVLPLKLALV